MYYIEEADKPKILDKLFGKIKLQENKILLPNSVKNLNLKQSIRLAKKTNKILEKAQSNKIILSKKIQENTTYVNLLNSYNYYIVDGKILLEALLSNILDCVIVKKQIKKEETSLSILVNNLNEYVLENIKCLANEYKLINIVTNHLEKFKKVEEQIYNNYGLLITVTNNKKKSLSKSPIIVNIDFPTELINTYNIYTEAIILDIKGNVKIKTKRFNGIIINSYEIKTDAVVNNGKYLTKELYEAKLYPNMKFNEIKNRIIKDKVEIQALFGWNGEIL